MRKRIAAIALFAFVGNPAQAAFENLVDFGTHTLDTNTGLMWLDVTETIGLSFFDVVNGVENSWYAMGWRHATTTEVCELISAHAAPPLIRCPRGVEIHFGDVVTPLQSLLGITQITGLGSPLTQGFFDDGGGSYFQGLALLHYFPGPDHSKIQVQVDILSPERRGSQRGHFLVRFVPEPLIVAAIEIKPGSDPNSINPLSQGVIPVAILGSEAFDVANAGVATLAFGPDEAAPAHKVGGHFEDVNDDGLTDLLSHYRVGESGIAFGDTEACVTGETLEGTPFEGCDVINTQPPCGSGFAAALVVPPLLWIGGRRRRARS